MAVIAACTRSEPCFQGACISPGLAGSHIPPSAALPLRSAGKLSCCLGRLRWLLHKSGCRRRRFSNLTSCPPPRRILNSLWTSAMATCPRPSPSCAYGVAQGQRISLQQAVSSQGENLLKPLFSCLQQLAAAAAADTRTVCCPRDGSHTTPRGGTRTGVQTAGRQSP